MNKIVRDHYPVAKLPEDLREGFSQSGTVKVVIEIDERSPFAYTEEKDRALTLEEMLRRKHADPSAYSGRVTMEEAVSRIRELRDREE